MCEQVRGEAGRNIRGCLGMDRTEYFEAKSLVRKYSAP